HGRARAKQARRAMPRAPRNRIAEGGARRGGDLDMRKELLEVHGVQVKTLGDLVDLGFM
ncbi:Unknown protein, partial [Striga hermonthica]